MYNIKVFNNGNSFLTKMVKANIQIVEDERIVAFNIQKRLEEIGYAVSANVASGEEAIQKAAQTPPDLVLMDIKLKGRIDGIEAASEIQSSLNIPVVYLTAYTDEETLQRAKVTEPYGYILKPFDTRDLCTTIEIALHKHQMEQQLRYREQWYATTLRSIGDAVIATDPKGAVTFMNPVAETLTQWKQEEVMGNDLTQVFKAISEKTRDMVDNPVKKALEEGVTVGLEKHTLLITKDGTEIPIDDSAAPIKKEDGSIIGAVLVFHDVIERQQAEALLQRTNQELEARVAERTAELRQANEQLRSEIEQRQRLEAELRLALEKEQELSELKSRIISTISHEYRTPLTTITFSTELLEKYGSTLPDSKKSQYFQRIRAAIQRMTNLVNDMLFIYQADVGKLEFKPTQLDVEQLVREWVDEFKLNAVTQHQIVFEHQGTCKNALDETLLYCIFGNLLSNGIKYSPEESVVRVELLCQQSQVVIRISDQGIGIPSADRAKLFNPFERGSNVGTIPGVGLGLANVKQCVDLHGGEITVESEIGVGTTFTVTLPSAEALISNEEDSGNRR